MIARKRTRYVVGDLVHHLGADLRDLRQLLGCGVVRGEASGIADFSRR